MGGFSWISIAMAELIAAGESCPTCFTTFAIVCLTFSGGEEGFLSTSRYWARAGGWRFCSTCSVSALME